MKEIYSADFNTFVSEVKKVFVDTIGDGKDSINNAIEDLKYCYEDTLVVESMTNYSVRFSINGVKFEVFKHGEDGNITFKPIIERDADVVINTTAFYKKLALSPKQSEALERAMSILTDNGIAIGHDYYNMGTLFAYSFANLAEEGKYINAWGHGKSLAETPDICEHITENATFLDGIGGFSDERYLFLSEDCMAINDVENLNK